MLAINGCVLDVSRFAALHPAGAQILLQHAGTDATEVFFSLHRAEVWHKYRERLQVGTLASESESAAPLEAWHELSAVPYAESGHWAGMPCPAYYNKHHEHARLAIRQWLAENARDELDALDDSQDLPTKEMYLTWGSAGMLALQIGPGPWLKRVPLLGGRIDPDKVDYFTELIVHEERARLMAPGAEDAMITGVNVTLPAILNYGTEEMRGEFATKVLRGEIRLALAITETLQGSDVANIQTTAARLPDGNYVLNGVKKWITNSCFADYFLVLARTGGADSGRKGLTYFLVKRCDEIDVRYIPTDYSGSAGTGLVIFENAVVGPECIVGGLGNGFKVCVSSFNHERWTIAVYTIARAREALAETFKWVMTRKAFGQRLADQPVVRYRLADAHATLEAAHAFLERITYQLNRLPYEEAVRVLSGPTALLKYQSTKAAKAICEVCVELFGGRGVTRTGPGRKVERFSRSLYMPSIYGGSSDVMLDYAGREAMKLFPVGRARM